MASGDYSEILIAGLAAYAAVRVALDVALYVALRALFRAHAAPEIAETIRDRHVREMAADARGDERPAVH